MTSSLQQPAPTRAPRSRRHGLSLLELLIVLGLLVIVAAMAAPALERPLAAQKLRKAAELVQSQWDKARVRAMQTGQILVFQYQPTTGRYRVQPWTTEESLVESSATVDPTNPNASSGAVGVLAELPEGVEFLTSFTQSDTRSLSVEEELSRMSQSASLENSWSAPVLFYPDGTATSAEVTLANQTGSYVSIRLRGLTGVARVGDVLSTGTGEAPQ